ncbi:hypothetical protein D3C84_814480 [compost metagenome]
MNRIFIIIRTVPIGDDRKTIGQFVEAGCIAADRRIGGYIALVLEVAQRGIEQLAHGIIGLVPLAGHLTKLVQVINDPTVKDAGISRGGIRRVWVFYKHARGCIPLVGRIVLVAGDTGHTNSLPDELLLGPQNAAITRYLMIVQIAEHAIAYVTGVLLDQPFRLVTLRITYAIRLQAYAGIAHLHTHIDFIHAAAVIGEIAA